MFDQFYALPEGFLDISASDLHRLLPKPSLIHLKGRQQAAVFVSILLHGNEDVGLKAIQALLKNYLNHELPRSLSIFCGNIQAARYGLRHLDGQPDFNRIWPGSDHEMCQETQMAEAIIGEFKHQGLFASIDLHNNTGLNPHYACTNRLDSESLHLARLFSRTVVYFQRPLGVQSMAFASLCPSVTLECGKAGSNNGVIHAAEMLDAVLNLQKFPTQAPHKTEIDLFHTVGIVKIPEHLSFSFGNQSADLIFDEALDHLNFCELPEGFEFAKISHQDAFLRVADESGQDVSKSYFNTENDRLLLARELMPSMLTLDTRVIRQDCLCYFMERLDWAE